MRAVEFGKADDLCPVFCSLFNLRCRFFEILDRIRTHRHLDKTNNYVFLVHTPRSIRVFLNWISCYPNSLVLWPDVFAGNGRR